MSPGKLGLLLVALVALSALPIAIPPRGYGVTLIIEGKPFEIDGKLLCRDIAGSIVVMFGSEFHTLDICELLERRVVRVGFEEGVKDWLRRLGELGIREGMRAEEVLESLRRRGIGGVTMPSVSVTFWLVGDGVHYIANDVFTSQDYYMARGLDYFGAFLRMLEDPLAVVRGYPPIVVRLEDLAKRLIPVNLTRAIEAARRELGLEEPAPKSEEPAMAGAAGSAGAQFVALVAPESLQTVATQTVCPPGLVPYDIGVCAWQNYWGFSDTPEEWFSNKVWVSLYLDRNKVLRDLWTRFVEVYSTAYLFDKSRYATPGSVWNYLTVTVATNPCRKLQNVETAVDMTYVVRECLRPSYVPYYYVDWRHTMARGARFTLYKPFVISVVSRTGYMPPMTIIVDYGSVDVGFKNTGFSLAGVMIWGEKAYWVEKKSHQARFNRDLWNMGVRTAALIVPTDMTYQYDAIVFTWNIKTYSYGGREYWLAEPVSIVTPYYREEKWQQNWVDCYYDASGKCVGYCPSYAWNLDALNDLVRRLTENVPTRYYRISDKMHRDIPINFETIDNSISIEVEGGESLASVLFGIARDLALNLFGKYIPWPFSMLLSLIDYADTTFRASVVTLSLRWARDGPPLDIRVTADKMTKREDYLSPKYIAAGRRPTVARYVVTVW